ncbi:unnamed protein product, partial [Ectocarpus sp. 12 AP-2014]
TQAGIAVRIRLGDSPCNRSAVPAACLPLAERWMDVSSVGGAVGPSRGLLMLVVVVVVVLRRRKKLLILPTTSRAGAVLVLLVVEAMMPLTCTMAAVAVSVVVIMG